MRLQLHPWRASLGTLIALVIVGTLMTAAAAPLQPPRSRPETEEYEDDAAPPRSRDDRQEDDRQEDDRQRDDRQRDDRQRDDRQRDDRDIDPGISAPDSPARAPRFDRRVLPPYLDPPDRSWPDDDRWVLGIYSQITSTGVRVRDVVPGSPAQRAGLETDDVIVTVDGFQVGRVGSRTYPLGEELQIRAGRRGDVLLLVRNRRNGQLLNLPVELARRGGFEYARPRTRSFGQPDDADRFRQRGDEDDRSPAADDLDREGVE